MLLQPDKYITPKNWLKRAKNASVPYNLIMELNVVTPRQRCAETSVPRPDAQVLLFRLKNTVEGRANVNVWEETAGEIIGVLIVSVVT